MFIVVASDVAPVRIREASHFTVGCQETKTASRLTWYLGLGAVFANARYRCGPADGSRSFAG
jgi:hypothetical protein